MHACEKYFTRKNFPARFSPHAHTQKRVFSHTRTQKHVVFVRFAKTPFPRTHKNTHFSHTTPRRAGLLRNVLFASQLKNELRLNRHLTFFREGGVSTRRVGARTKMQFTDPPWRFVARTLSRERFLFFLREKKYLRVIFFYKKKIVRKKKFIFYFWKKKKKNYFFCRKEIIFLKNKKKK